MTEIEADLDDAFWRFMFSLQKSRFFGIVEIHFRDGQIVKIKKQEVFVPKDLLRITAEQR